MKLIKTILISTTAIILFLLIILFSVQTIDYVINGKTYSKIDKFFKNIDILTKNDMCQSDFGDVIKYNMKHDNLPPQIKAHKNFDKLSLRPELYSKAILSCNQYKDDVLALEIPKDIPADKQILLKKYVKINSEISDSLLAKLDKYKNYNGYIKAQAMRDAVPFQTFRKIAEMKLTKIQAQKRFSFGYYLISFSEKHKVENQLKMANEIQKRELQKTKKEK